MKGVLNILSTFCATDTPLSSLSQLPLCLQLKPSWNHKLLQMRRVMPVASLLLLLLHLATRAKGSRLLEEENLRNEVHGNLMEGGSCVRRRLSCASHVHCSDFSLSTDARGSSKTMTRSVPTKKSYRSNEKKVVASTRQEARHVEPPNTKRRQTYLDTLAIAGMDYSPASRGAPIHN